VLSLRDLNRATLARQLLLSRAKLPVPQAVEQVAGLQAQLARAPFVGLWSRLQDFSSEALLAALRKKTVVRATSMRGTLHLMSAKDYLRFRTALRPAITQIPMAALRERTDAVDLQETLRVGRGLFSEPHVFEDLRELLPGDARAGGYLVRTHLPLVQAVDEGQRHGFAASPRFVDAEKWLGRKISPDPSSAGLFLRYLRAFGPATAADFQAFSGLRDARETVASVREQLVSLRDERKRELFDLPDAPRPEGDAPVRFLPEFDSLLLAHKDRTRVLADAHRKRVYLPGLRVAATVLVDGFVAATWQVVKKDVVVTALEGVRLPRKQVLAEAESLAGFLGESGGVRIE
jgi:hypothetical protein